MNKPENIPEIEKEKEIALVPVHTEFETKYRVDPAMLIEFKRIMGTLEGFKHFQYVESPDSYFTNDHIINAFTSFAATLKDKDAETLKLIVAETIGKFPPFIRYRRPPTLIDNPRQELTTKFKKDGSKNNIQREEKNLRVDQTSAETIQAFVSDIGYKPNFEIWKTCHIYHFTDATLVFYSVYDTTDGKVSSKMDSFVEIEVDEDTVSSMTENQAWAIIEKYEKALEPIGLTARNRLRKSLFEMYKKDVK